MAYIGKSVIGVEHPSTSALTATTGTFSGSITTDGMTTSADINFGDSDKAIFGADDDLQIYHDGNNSFITDSGTGALYIQGTSGVFIRSADGGENLAAFADDGAATLYHNNAAKLATAATGVSVTGTVTATTVQANAGGTFTTASGNDLNIVYPAGRSLFIKMAGTTHVTVNNAGNVVLAYSLSVGGSVSKASGSFKIPHPLEAKKDTHHLVHSFVEGPQADNLYRGKVALVDGTATQNIDTVAGMTEGTFAALNREVQCFTTNETGWTAVKGSVSGNVLTITAQENTCTDTISWMVIGERKDQHMYDTDWTDHNGKVIVEPEVG